jgi:dTDP-4-amino-4,6-dideoxygalactose transaminase
MTYPAAVGEVRIPFVDLAHQHTELRTDLSAALNRVLSHGIFILGPEVAALEEEFAAYCGTRYAVGVANGTDALWLTLKALGIGPGDEVITAPNSFLASASVIALAGARPVFVDVRDDYNLDPDLLESAITSRTRAILPVHLTGRPADMGPILAVAGRHSLAVVEDAAQAVGARYQGQRVGSFGVAGCFSFHPLKILNAWGDGGMVTTNDEAVYRYLLKARNHGLQSRDECEFWGHNSRLDTVQAAVLSVKLKHLDTWIEAHRQLAAFYSECLADVVQVPNDAPHEYSVYQTFVVQAEGRDQLQSYLRQRGVETKVHYPIPIHLQQAAAYLGYRAGDFPMAERQAKCILSLPLYAHLSQLQRDQVVSAVKGFYRGENRA